MASFKNILINCRNCHKKLIVKQSDSVLGTITCSHIGCGQVNVLDNQMIYDKGILKILCSFGKLLVQHRSPEDAYNLAFGKNIIGTSDQAQVLLKRSDHIQNGKCYISRLHCTITVQFNDKKGVLEYTISDGCTIDGKFQSSLNGTFVNSMKLKNDASIFIKNGDIIGLGPNDNFKFEEYIIPQIMLDTYLIDSGFNPDATEV